MIPLLFLIKKIHVNHFVKRLKTNSILNFTTEHMIDNTIHFLDVNLKINHSGNISTSVYIKPTDKGTYVNYNSHTLLQYKKSTIKTLVKRAIKISSSWQNFHFEIERLKHVFANNNYPQNLTEKIIQNELQKYHCNTNNTLDTTDNLQCFVRLYDLSNFKHDTKIIRNLINNHVKPINDHNIKITTYFKPYKLGSCFSTRTIRNTESRVNVVYQFSCPQAGCNASYIGYTTNKLSTRCSQHRYSPSSIQSHYSHDHQMLQPPKTLDFITNFKILHSYNELISLKIAESISIKQNNPYINIKYNESFSILKLF